MECDEACEMMCVESMVWDFGPGEMCNASRY